MIHCSDLDAGHDNEILVRVRGLTKIYPGAAADLAALKNLNFNISRGEFVGVIGESGAGKSTLVNMLTGVDRVTTGEVWAGETPVHALAENESALWRGINVGVVYQSFELMPSLTILENILLPMDFCGRYHRPESINRAMSLLRMVELEDQAHKLPATLSGGQKQRAAIARALANDPPLVVADEPTGNLDTVTSEVVLRLFEDLTAAGKSILMVTHDLSLAHRFCRVLHIVDGEIRVVPDEVRG